jgi:hypothetical protein
MFSVENIVRLTLGKNTVPQMIPAPGCELEREAAIAQSGARR